ncbi:unnamed protein product, partial [Rotaria sp. Silwood1]
MASHALSIDDFHTNTDDMRLEIFCLIWLDTNANATEIRDTEQRLRSIINHLKKFKDVEQCQKYIEERSQKDRLGMLVSGQFVREIVPVIHQLRQVISIYVYCFDKKRNEKWACKFAKVKAVVVELDELISRIKAEHKIQKMVEEPLSINIFTTSAGAGKSTTGLNGQFVFSQLLIDCLLRLKYTEEDKKELIRICKQQYEGNSDELSNLLEFLQDYSPNNVLWWYTRESFFYKTLNVALRTQDIHLIFLFRAYISDIHHQLKGHQAKNSLRVYRSQRISSDELSTLQQCCGQFISVNSFFSTSTDYQHALSFLNVPDGTNNLEPVLFEIDANPKVVTTKPFAEISAYSEFSDESEVLFMLGSIFRLKSVNHNSNDQVWVIKMTVCSENEHELKHVLTDMKKQLGSGETNLHKFGKLLWEMGKPDLAEKYFIRMIGQLPPNDLLLADLYQDLGKLASYAGDLDKSMEWRQKAIALKNPNALVGTVTIDQHTDYIHVFYEGQPIAGSPFKFHVDQVQTDYVTAYGSGLSHGVCNESCDFRIVTKDAGSGGLSVTVEGSSKAEIQCEDNKDGTCDVTYWPTAPGEYTIAVKFAGKHIVGSPFTAKITGSTLSSENRKRSQVMGGNQSEISLRVTEIDIHDLNATKRSPSGIEDICLLKKLANGSLGISFIPKEIGEHLVNVYRDGKNIENSPFRIHVDSSEIGDASKVKVSGRGLKEGYANQFNDFTVVTRDAGYGGLSLSIEGPSKADIECHDNEDGSCLVTYRPTEPGIYILNVKFADKHVSGSPFTVSVGG